MQENREQGTETFVIEGRNAVLEAFRSGRTIDKIYILHDVNAISRGRKIRDLVKSRIRAERGAGCEN